MYKTKQQIDKHVVNVLGRIRDENERKNRGYQIAKLYYEIKEYDIAKRYLAGFLSIRDNYAPAHKLHGQVQEGLENWEQALDAYKRSLDYDERQRDVVLKICDLYCKTGVDPERARYWADRADKLSPGNPVVFRLREKIVALKEGEDGMDDMENLITSELIKQPHNPKLRAKLMKLFIDTGRINEAYTHAVEVEEKEAYPTSLEWCHALLDVFEAYQKQSGNINGTFHQQLLTVLARLTGLSLDQAKVADVGDALFRFDQGLVTVSKASLTGPIWETFFCEMQAQYYSYAGNLLLKRAQQEHLSWADATNMAAACFLVSYSVPPPNLQAAWVVKASEKEKRCYAGWHSRASLRASEAGHLLFDLSDGEGSRWATRIHSQWSGQVARTKLFDSLFTLRHMKGMRDSSFWMTCDMFSSINTLVPSEHQLRELDRAHQCHPDSLRHLVWLALHYHRAKDDVQPDYCYQVFADLQYESATNLDVASPETLSQLDTEAFLYAVVHSSAQQLTERNRLLRTSECQPRLLPLCFGEELCSAQQAEWWRTAYQLNKNMAREELGRLRLVLQRGIETIRLIGNHGMPVSMVVHLARVFALRAQEAESLSSATKRLHLEERAVLYWKEAVDMLDRLARNQALWSPKKRLFADHGPALSKLDVEAGLEEGRLFHALHAMKRGQHEEALDLFAKLGSAEASYQQAKIYRTMAEDAERQEDDENSLQAALLTKSRDALYLSLDRIRGERHHKLTSILPTELDDVEARLNRLISGTSETCRKNLANETDGLPEPPSSSAPMGASFNTSTPQKPSPYSRIPESEQLSIHYTRPSPERLDAQVRSLTMSQELLIKQLMIQNEELKNQNKVFSEEIAKNKEEIEKLKSKVEASNTSGMLFPASVPPMPPGSPAMRPPLPGAPPPPHYPNYRPHEYDYSGGTPHPSAALAAYSPHPHGYPLYAPPPPIPPYYAYQHGPPPPSQPPPPPPPHAAAAALKSGLPKVATPVAAVAPHVSTTQDDDEEDGYYIYDEDEFGENEEEDPEAAVPGHDQPCARPGVVAAAGAAAAAAVAAVGSFHIPDSQLTQDWPYGNTVNLEGKSTLTYSPTHPMPQTGYFSQMPPPPRQPVPPAAMYGSAVAPPPAIGPGFFSSPERPGAYGPHFQSPTHLAMPNPQAPGMVGLGGTPATLSPPKPGFLPAATVKVASTGAAIVPPPNAALTTTGGVINPPASTPISTTTSGTTIVSAATSEQAGTPSTNTANTSATFGTKFIMSMPPGSTPPKPPASLNTPAFGFGSTPIVNPSTIDGGEQEDDDDMPGDDSYQGPDFEPVIPLPDEVQVVTGEEEENILFQARTKLFRFVEKQWKERGIGEIKILHHKASGRVRIVMRRDQVHKVCANHPLNSTMTIDFKSPSEKKILTWQAMDFADGESRMEQFCAKFKTEDIALQFKDKFEEGMKMAKEKKTTSAAKPTAKPAEPAKENLMDKFKPKEGSWTCNVCMITNTPEAKRCAACTTPKPGATPEEVTDSTKSKLTLSSGGGFTFGGKSLSFGTPDSGTAKTGGFSMSGFMAAPPAGEVKFGSSAESTAKTTDSAGNTTTVSTPKSTPASTFVFGNTSTPGGVMFGNKATAVVTTSTTPSKPAVPVIATSTVTASPAPGGKPSIVFGSSGSTLASTATSKTSPAISPPKFNFVQGATTTAATATTTTTTTQPVFSFGGNKLGSAFSFGETKKPEAAATPASDMLKGLANKAKPTDTPNPKATVGGFTFNAKPIVTQEKKEEQTEVKEQPKQEETKVSPFAGFSFGSPQKPTSTTSTPTFGAFSSMGTPTFGTAASTPVTKPPTEAKDANKTESHAFGSNSDTAGLSFSSLVKGVEKPDAFAKKSDFKGFSGAGQKLFQTKSPGRGEGGENAEDESYEPDVDFKPIIPLPDLVIVSTGEENEERLFCERAKLFRHDPETKQWKERGIGEMKILQHKESNRCRLLMRREQVLKICCNQSITPDLKLVKMATSEKAWCWVGQNYSDGEMKLEQLACKFKTIEMAERFKVAFDRAQQMEVKETSKPAEEKKKETQKQPQQRDHKQEKPKHQQEQQEKEKEKDKTPQKQDTKQQQEKHKEKTPEQRPQQQDAKQPSLQEQFAIKDGEWNCEVCLVKNKSGVATCAACNASKPGTSSQQATTPIQSSNLFSNTPTSSGLGGFTFGSKSGFSFASGSSTSDTPPSSTAPFTFTPSSSTGGFNFGKAVETKPQGFNFTPAKTEVSSSTDTGFVFGKDSPHTGFSFSGVTPSKPLDLSATRSPKSPKSPGAPDDFYVNQDGEDSHIYFEPIVHLEKVEVKTGEEDEDVMYCHRAKLFRFINNEWKERGLGDVKILCHKTTKKNRIVMRREQVHKLCLNHFITPKLELKPMPNAKGKAWVWHAEDFGEGEIKHEQLAIRFKDVETAQSFKEAFQKAQGSGGAEATQKKEGPQAQSSAPDSTTDKGKPTDTTAPSKQAQKDVILGDSTVSSTSQVQQKSMSGTADSGGTPGSFSFKLPEGVGKEGLTFGSGGGFGTASTTFGTAKGFSFGSPGGLSSGSIFGGSPSSSSPSTDKPAPAEFSKSPLSRGKSLLVTMLEDPLNAADLLTKSKEDSGDDNDIEIVFEKRATPEQIERARKLQLPDHFYLYEDKPPCPGCRGCEDGDGKKISQTSDQDVIYLGKDKPTPEQAARAEALQLPPHFYLYEDRPACPGCDGCEKGDKEALCTAGGNKPPPTKPTSSTDSQQTEPDSTTVDSGGIFGGGAKETEFSFSALATGGGFAFGKKESDKPFKWQGAGASLFQSPGSPGGWGGGDGEDDDGVVASEDVHFEPIVSLPEVEVRTGEEEENVLYAQRAKLFRWDANLKQWKERGVGELKLLQHQVTGKIRVLLRREQVLKLACNHLLTADMRLTTLQTSEVAWCWNAVDIAEGEARPENFAAKFRTPDIANTFKEKFEECVEIVSKMAAAAPADTSQTPSASTESPNGSPAAREEGAAGNISTSSQQAEEGDSEETEEEEEEDQDPLFSKRATMMYAEGQSWKTIGMGDLRVFYDDDVNAFRIKMITDKGATVCSHIICREYSLQCNEAKHFCEWAAKDFATDDPVKRIFRVQFSSKVAVQEFRRIFSEGCELAIDSGIFEAPDHTLPPT